MKFIKKCIPCFFSKEVNNLDKLVEDDKLVMDDKYELNKITIHNETSHKKHKKYVYKSQIIKKLELNNTENYAKIIDIYDADTLTCILFFRGIPNVVKIRLDGIDAPEMRPTSSDDIENVQERALAIIGKFAITKIIMDQDNIIYIKTKGSEKYGRTLADIYTDKDSTLSINQILINLKLADSYFGKTKEKLFKHNYLNIECSNKVINIYNKNDNFFNKFKSINEIYNITHDI